MNAGDAAVRIDLGAFGRHYLEMVLAMAAGMMPYAMVFGRGMAFTTYGDEAVMAAFMTVPMVAWMRYRGHGWRPNAEMAASMFLPTFAIIALLAASVVEGFMTLMMLEHIVMPVTMLGAMLLRPQEYTTHRAVTA